MDERRHDAAPALLPVRKAAWNAERSRTALSDVRARVAGRARLERRGVALLAVAACGLAIFAAWPERVAPSPAQVAAVSRKAVIPSAVTPLPATHDETRTLHFADGSSVKLLDAHAHVEVERVAPEQVEVAMQDGKSEFSVAAEPGRRFVVHVARMSIEVLGSVFTVTRAAERVHVRVESGEVEVSAGDQRRKLVADEAAWFALTAAPIDETRVPTTVREAPNEAAHARFLQHARHRQYARAMDVIRQKPSVVRDNGEELMLAADAARLSGDAPAAVPYLKRVTEQHARDSRAPLAAFTLGRIYLFDLGRPAEARAAFALTRRLSAQGALAEDALAREVEAAARAGAQQEARTLANEYLTRYPQGRRRTQVQGFAGPR